MASLRPLRSTYRIQASTRARRLQPEARRSSTRSGQKRSRSRSAWPLSRSHGGRGAASSALEAGASRRSSCRAKRSRKRSRPHCAPSTLGRDSQVRRAARLALRVTLLRLTRCADRRRSSTRIGPYKSVSWCPQVQDGLQRTEHCGRSVDRSSGLPAFDLRLRWLRRLDTSAVVEPFLRKVRACGRVLAHVSPNSSSAHCGSQSGAVARTGLTSTPDQPCSRGEFRLGSHGRKVAYPRFQPLV